MLALHSSLIPPGMRAFTMQAACVTGDKAGFVLPGNKVDVLFKLRDSQDDETGGSKATTLMQAVEVLAVEPADSACDRDNGDGPGPTSMTLLVTPEQASILDLGQQMGQLTVSLCYPVGSEDLVESATIQDLVSRGLLQPASDGSVKTTH